jgi:hypothetical protein
MSPPTKRGRPERRPHGSGAAAWTPERYTQLQTFDGYPYTSHDVYMRLLARRIREIERRERAS